MKPNTSEIQRITNIFRTMQFEYDVNAMELAEKYFQEHDYKFVPFCSGKFVQASDYTEWKEDVFKNKVCVTNVLQKASEREIIEIESVLLFSKCLKDKSKLISQLHFGLNQSEVTQDIVRICKELEAFCSESKQKHYVLIYPQFSTGKNEFTFLSFIQLIIQSIQMRCSLLTFNTHVNNAALATVLIELALQCGFPANIFQVSFAAPHETRGSTGSVGMIITESGELDTPIDILMNLNTYDCNRISTVLVQESIYEIFKQKIEHCTKQLDGKECGDMTIKADYILLQQNNVQTRVLLWNGSTDCFLEGIHVIKCESYRTTKELLSILQNSSLDKLSLWCDKISIANDICHNAQVRHMWINGINLFENKIFELSPYDDLIVDDDELKYIRKNQKTLEVMTWETIQSMIMSIPHGMIDMSQLNFEPKIIGNYILNKLLISRNKPVCIIVDTDITDNIFSHIKTAFYYRIAPVLIFLSEEAQQAFYEQFTINKIPISTVMVTGKIDEKCQKIKVLHYYSSHHETDYNNISACKRIWTPLSETFSN